MSFLNTIAGISCLILSSANASSQIVLNTPVSFADSGDLIAIDFSVVGYQEMISSQGTIRFDETVLEYSHVDNFALASISAGSFGETDIATGLLSFSWYESNLVGKSIADNVPAFTMHFTVIGNPGDTSRIELIDQPVLAEFVDTSFNAQAFLYQEGKVTVNGGTAGIITQVEKYEFTVFPNPASDWIQIETKTKSENIDVLWYSMQGSLIKKDHFRDGENVMRITTNELNRGAYLLRIGTNDLGFENRLIEIL